MTSSQLQLIAIILSAMGIIFIPMLIMLYRGIVKWTRTEDKLDELVRSVSQLVKDKDQTHDLMLKQMADDRRATDGRLRWLEEYVWKKA